MHQARPSAPPKAASVHRNGPECSPEGGRAQTGKQACSPLPPTGKAVHGATRRLFLPGHRRSTPGSGLPFPLRALGAATRCARKPWICLNRNRVRAPHLPKPCVEGPMNTSQGAQEETQTPYKSSAHVFVMETQASSGDRHRTRILGSRVGPQHWQPEDRASSMREGEAHSTADC